jgi:protein-S-isoprenylcysteine O-methyltransferase Ste14
MPPKRLVVTGFYRYVRNPMYVAVTALIAGQGLLFGSVTVLEYGAIVWAGFFLFVVALRRARAERAVCGRVQALSG